MAGRRRRFGAFIGLCAALLMGTIPFGLSSAFAASGTWTGVADNDILVSDTVSALANGVTQHVVVSNNEQGTDQNIEYLAEVDIASDDVQIVAGYGDNDASSWQLTRTTDMAASYERDNPGKTVVAAINADYFNMATGEPSGALVMEGKVCHASNGRYYFGITKDGEAVIRNSNDLSDLEMAVGGNQLLVQDGKALSLPADGLQNITYARCAIGIKPDGTVLTLTTHGNFAPTSCGRWGEEIAQILANAGCTTALELDGGGSATYASREEGEEDLTVKNSPRDGAERNVSSSILIVSSSTPTGVFDHASLSPNNEVYTPSSEVQFSAKGIDTAGSATDLPSGLQFQLSQDSAGLGTIDAQSGLFISNGKEGTVTVEAVVDGEVVGSTSIVVAGPDEIYFASDEVSLGFEETSDLGLVLRYQMREINYKEGDVIWDVSDPAMGSFQGNLFISSDGETIEGTITATSAFDSSVSGQVHVIVGKEPTIVWNFEDITDEETGEVVTTAEDYYIGTEESPGILSTTNYGRGGKESIEIVSIDDDEPVRFNQKSLKLNYDFTECGEVTEGACIGTSEAYEIPGTPTAIGVWVYAPEGVGIEYEGDGSQAGFWLRGYVVDGAGNTQPYDFTLEPKAEAVANGEQQPGIYWEGWMYLEADLTHLKSPYTIPANMALRLMYVAGTKMGTKTANSIYFDNLQFVYGTNVEDVDNPVVDNITLNGEQLEDGMTIDTNVVNIDAVFHDVENKYTSGIDTTTVRLQIDGVNVLDNERYESAYDESVNQVHLYNCELNDGEHSVTVYTKDLNGNDVTETRYFTVDTGSTGAQSGIEVAPTSEGAVIGKTVDLDITSEGDAAKTASVSIVLASGFSEYEVTVGSGYDISTSYSKMSRAVTIEATRKDDASTDDTLIATLSVSVPTSLKDGDSFTYRVKSGSFVTINDVYNTFSGSEQKIPVVAPLTIEANPVFVGYDATITVLDSDGNPVEGATILKSDTDEAIGTTAADGTLVTSALSAEAGDVTIYAQKGEEVSFTFKFSVYEAQGDETGLADGIHFNAVDDLATEKNVSWFSNPLYEGQQILQYRVKGSDSWNTVDAESTLLYFSKGGNKTAYSNNVTLTGLAPETTYEFTVGVEGAMSDIREFTTETQDPSTHSFFVIGDIQEENTTNIEAIISQLSEGSYDFGAQTGDATDDPTLYEDWPTLSNIFGDPKLGGTSIVNVLGNHEYNGDANGSIASAIYDNDTTAAGSCWSVQYGDLYIAVMNYGTNASQMREAASWLIEDANASNAKWRILFTHQPPYFTNASGGNDIVYSILPEAIDSAGIDAVFSGHDHSATRTNPLKGDEVDEKGTVYYICGSTGGKEYSITSQNKFDYDKVFALATIDYTATYLTASIEGDTMTVTINDIDAGPIDTFEISSKCHEIDFDASTGSITCTRCGQSFDDYTGTLTDADGNSYYFLNGKMQTGWVLIGEDYHYYGTDGIEEEVSVKEQVDTTCVRRGHTIYVSESGDEQYVQGPIVSGHEYETQENGDRICTVCGWKYVELKDCTIELSSDVTTYTGSMRKPTVTVTTPDGVKLYQLGDVQDYQVFTYTADELAKQDVQDMLTNVGTATLTLKAYRPGKYVDLNDYRGNCGGETEVTYRIVPPCPSSANIARSSSSAELSWSEVVVNGDEPVDKYIVYRSTDGGDTYKVLATTTKTTYVDKTYKSGYKYRIGSRCVINGENYDSKTNRVPSSIQPSVSISNRTDGKTVLSWTAYDGVTYEIYRATTTGSFSKIATTSKAQYVDTSAKVATKYRYKVKAIKGSYSATSTVQTAERVCAQPVVTTSNRLSGKPSVTWGALSGASKYQLYISTSGKTGTFNLSYTGTSTTVAHNSAKSGVKYYYKVCAVTKNGGKSEFSEVATGQYKAVSIEASISNRASDGYPVITWNKVSGASKYQVYRATSKNGTYKLLYTAKGTKLTNTSAVEGTTYYYKVRPVASNGTKGSFSNVVSGKFMGTPIEISVSYRASDGSPVIEWNKVPGAAKYKLYRSTSGKTGTFNVLVNTSGCKITNTSANPGVTYYYKVRAVSKKGTLGDLSDAVTAVRDVSNVAPTVSSTNRISDGKPKLSWTKVAGATSYVVYVSTTGEGGDYSKLFTGSGTVLSHTSAKTGNTYSYKVQAVFSNGETSAFSDPITVEAISVDIELEGSNRASDGAPVITWNKLPMATKYEVYRSSNGKNGTFKKIYTTTGQKFTNISVEERTTYYYKVRGVSSDGTKGSFSNVVEHPYLNTTLKAEVANRESDGVPVITWNEVPGAVKYEVYVSTDGANGTFTRLISLKSEKVTHTSSQEGVTYYYKVRAVSNGGVKTAFSDPVQGSRAS